MKIIKHRQIYFCSEAETKTKPKPHFEAAKFQRPINASPNVRHGHEKPQINFSSTTQKLPNRKFHPKSSSQLQPILYTRMQRRATCNGGQQPPRSAPRTVPITSHSRHDPPPTQTSTNQSPTPNASSCSPRFTSRSLQTRKLASVNLFASGTDLLFENLGNLRALQRMPKEE